MAKPADVRGLSPQDPLREAAGKILWTRFEEMWAQRDKVIPEFDADGVHDMRVASRRLRTAMQTFRPCFPRRSYRAHYRCIRELADLLGEVRDRDVQLEELEADLETLPGPEQPGLRSLAERLRSERETHREALQRLLQRLDRDAYDRSFLGYIARQVEWQGHGR